MGYHLFLIMHALYSPNQVIQTDIWQKHTDFDIFLFINTKSGGCTGLRFKALEMETARFNMHGLFIHVSFFNLNEEEDRINGLKKLKYAVDKGYNCRAIVCGGDGTVLWVVNAIIDYGINIHKVPIGIVPIGTGNDFSRMMGWGGQQNVLVGEKLQRLKQLTFQWMDAEVVDFDVWCIEFTTYDNGCFKQVKGKEQVVVDHGTKTLTKSFTNYCSIGIDGRIGFTFDKKRGSSRRMNLLIYGCIGLGKLFSRIPKIDQIVYSMQQIMPQKHVHQVQGSILNQTQITTNQTAFQKQTIFLNTQTSPLRIKPGYGNIVAFNIDSFMGGCKGMWNNSSKLAVTGTNPGMYVPQSYSDGMLEFVAWKSQMDLAAQRVTNTGAKVAQGPGPFVYNFNRSPETDFHTYLQVDGQFYKVFHPKSLIFKRCLKSPGGYIKVLRNRGRTRKDFVVN